MIQATFDDENPETVSRWAYPNIGKWDAERNVAEFIEALPIYREHGLLTVTANFQGGSPEGYSKEQPWINTGLTAEGGLKPVYVDRMKRVLDKLDELGMVGILGYFYFGDALLRLKSNVQFAAASEVRMSSPPLRSPSRARPARAAWL